MPVSNTICFVTDPPQLLVRAVQKLSTDSLCSRLGDDIHALDLDNAVREPAQRTARDYGVIRLTATRNTSVSEL